jgi:hypothetical protein
MWIIFIAFIAFIAVLAIAGRLGRARVRRIARERAGEGFTDFAAHFAGQGIPREILLNTYDYFAECYSYAVERFPVRADDGLEDVYGIEDEDLAEAVGEILEKSGRRWFTESERPRWPRVETVRDVVLYVAAAPPA